MNPASAPMNRETRNRLTAATAVLSISITFRLVNVKVLEDLLARSDPEKISALTADRLLAPVELLAGNAVLWVRA